MKSPLLFLFFLATSAFSNHNEILDAEGILPPAANHITLTTLPIEIEKLSNFFDGLYAQVNAGVETDLYLVTPLFDQSEKQALFPFYESYFERLFECASNRFTLYAPCVRAYEGLDLGFIYARCRRI